MRALLFMMLLTISASGAAQIPTLRLCVDEGADELRDEIRVQLVDWEVFVEAPPEGGSDLERVASVRSGMGVRESVAWIESTGPESRLVVLRSVNAAPRSSPLPPRATPDWARVVALVLDGLLSGEDLASMLTSPVADVAAAPSVEARTTEERRNEDEPRPPGWPSPLARNGWMLRVGWLVSASPRHEDGFGAYARNASTWAEVNGGLRLRVGRWLTRFLRVDTSAHLAKTWFDIGLEGGLDVELMAVSATRFRMGGGVGFGALFVGERDRGTGHLFGWTGWWASLPMEVGFEFHRRSGMFIHIGPTWTKPPYAERPGPGFMMSVEAELDLGSHR